MMPDLVNDARFISESLNLKPALQMNNIIIETFSAATR